MFIAATVHNSQDVEATYMSINRCMDKQDVVYISSLVAQTVKNLPAMWKTQVQSLCWEDPLEKEMQPTPVYLGLERVRELKEPIVRE